jgi:putative transposase
MLDLFLLSRDRMSKIEPLFPKSRGVARVDDRRVASGVI